MRLRGALALALASALLSCALCNVPFGGNPGKVLTKDTYPNRYVWIGATNNDGFKIYLDVEQDDEELLVSDHKTNPRSRPAFRQAYPWGQHDKLDISVYKTMRRIQVKNLDAYTQYYIFLVKKPDAKRYPRVAILVAQHKTFPKKLVRQELVIALGSSQARAHDSRSLGEIALWRKYYEVAKPNATFLMLHMGDLHYANIARNSTADFHHAMRRVVTDHTARQMFTTMQVSYGWDDHDYGANNADHDSPSKWAALHNYKSMVPAPKSKGDGMYHAFSVGRIRIIITDLRSEADSRWGRIMSNGQLFFLREELQRWRTYDTLVWMSSRPWIDKAGQGKETWGGFATTRREIANLIAKERIDNLVLVTGDDMLAADDGTNSMYAEDKLRGQGFPVLQSAPLAQFGSSKGGPYSQGCHAYRMVKNNQYAILELFPVGVGDGMALNFNGYTATGVSHWSQLAKKKEKPVIKLHTERPFLAPNSVRGGGHGSCAITFAPWWFYIVLMFVVVGSWFGISFYVNKRKQEGEDEVKVALGTAAQPM